MSRLNPRPLLALAALALSSCAATSFDAKLLTANQTIASVVKSTDVALEAHIITADQAQAVSTMAHQVAPLIDAAKAANDANNPTTANKSLNAVNEILAGLQQYVASPTGATP